MPSAPPRFHATPSKRTAPAFHALYQTQRWRKAAQAFRAEHPFCGDRDGQVLPVMSECHRLGRQRLGAQVDHVEPHKGNVETFWNRANWQVLCAECGARKSQAGL